MYCVVGKLKLTPPPTRRHEYCRHIMQVWWTPPPVAFQPRGLRSQQQGFISPLCSLQRHSSFQFVPKHAEAAPTKPPLRAQGQLLSDLRTVIELLQQKSVWGATLPNQTSARSCPASSPSRIPAFLASWQTRSPPPWND